MAEKDRIIDSKNKEILALTMQIEDILNNQGKLLNSPELEAIRRNLLSEITELLARLKAQLKRAKSSIGNEPFQIERVVDKAPINYSQIPMSEDVFLNEIHSKLNDVDEAIAMANSIAYMVEKNSQRERTPNGRDHSNG